MKLKLPALIGLIGLMLAMPAWGELPKDLSLVPADTVAFVHVRAGAMWQYDMMKELRTTVAAAGPKAIAAFERQVYPSLADLDNITLALRLHEENPQQPPHVTVIVSFKNDVDGEKLAQLYLPDSRPGDFNGRKAFVDPSRDLALHMLDARHVVVGPPTAVQAFLARGPGNGQGALAAEITSAARGGKTVTVGLNFKAFPIPPDALDELPPEIRPLLRMERALLTLDLAAPEAALDLRAEYGSDAAAQEAVGAFRQAMTMAKQALREPRAEMEQKLYANADKGPQPLDTVAEAGMALIALGALNRVEAMMDTLPVARSGSELNLAIKLPRETTSMFGLSTAAAIGFLLPAVEKVRGAAEFASSSNNLKMMGLAMHNYESAYGRLPAAAICDPTGKPLLSWRVAILPYIEQETVFRQFKLDEPWDSPHNKALIEQMPQIYRSPRVPTRPGETVYKAFVGKDAIMDWKQSRQLQDITDGTANTVLLAEAGDPVIWTKPDDILFDYSKAAPKLELPGGNSMIVVCFADGSVRRFDLKRLSEKSIKDLINPADGNEIDFENLEEDAVPRLRPIPGTPPPPTAEAGSPPPVTSRPRPPQR